MSFGFSVGDFLAVINLANKIRKDFAGAPDHFKAISDEVRNLSFVVQDVEIDVSSKELDIKQQTELQGIAKSCRTVLSELENMIDTYRDLDGTGDTKRSIARRTWRRLKWEPSEIQELRQRIISNIALLDAFNGRMTRNSIRNLVQHQDEQKHQALLNWLSPSDYGAQQTDYIARRQPGTGQWLLDSPEFQYWISGSKQTLFCPGIPGAGKTILTSIVVQELYEQQKTDRTVGIAYLYCNFRLRHEQGLAHLLASLSRQLAQGQPVLPSALPWMYEEHNPQGTRPSVEELCRVLDSLAQTGGFSKVFIIIDALDECDVSNRSCSRLLDSIFNLQSECNVNIFATSRFIPEITERFKGMPTLEIRASKEDVTRYLRDNLSILPSFVSRNQDLQEEISTAITTAVDGMFLLAQLHLNSLIGKRSPKAIRSALKGLSSDVEKYESAYDDAMNRIQGQVPDKSEMAIQVLAWITCAKRPLTTIELQTALAVEIGESKFDPENIPDIVDMVSVCAGLVTVDEESDVIRLVHYTTQEYFERTQATWFPRAHHDIGRICISYLSLDVFTVDTWLMKTELDTHLSIDLHDFQCNHPLLVYAGHFWGHHVNTRVHSDDLETSDHQIIEFLSDVSKVNSCVRTLLWYELPSHSYCQCHYLRTRGYSRGYPVSSSKLATGLHLAVWFLMPRVIEKMISRGWPVDSRDSSGRTPLFWAACFGLSDIVSLLLEAGADPVMKDYDGETPFHAAACFESVNSTSIVRSLLRKAANSHLKDLKGNTPLWRASQHGQIALVKLFLDHDPNVNHGSVELDRVLHVAAANGHNEVVKLLRDRGADPGAVTGVEYYHGTQMIQTPLLAASMEGKESVVKLLLGWNVDVEVKNENSCSALSIAALRNHGEVVQLLLEKGANPNSLDDVGRTAFHWAAFWSHNTILESLAGYSPMGPNKRDFHGRTPLHVASALGHLQSVLALLAMKDTDL
ncbi:uncharacterized protein N7473_003714 [Penicillium subrubescens]|uniref:uncharacterized protein n=1 Tax=Penicillium subrubescens TaxID=1316194 RepID=UPI002545641E|nr:uncharacterized protein N7473_003714 [Penicillium subrubescens]KAJ5906798.1 hypothetical protein N7473_003714 [Penicillium subrubescens]